MFHTLFGLSTKLFQYFAQKEQRILICLFIQVHKISISLVLATLGLQQIELLRQTVIAGEMK